MSELDISHDEGQQKFRVKLEGTEAYLSYRRADPSTLEYASTWVPPEHRHRGIGEQLVRHALAYAHQRRYGVIPSCPFVRWVMDRDPEYQAIRAR